MSYRHCVNFFLLITRRLFKLWHSGAALPLLLVFQSAPGVADDLSMTMISMGISAPYPTNTMIIEMTLHNPMRNLFGDHSWKQAATGEEMIPSCQHLEDESRQLNQVLLRWDSYILTVGRSGYSWKRRMNVIPHSCHPRRYSIKCVNNWIRQQMTIFIRGTIQTKPVSNWAHGTLEMCGDLNPLLTTWQASLAAQNTMPSPLFQEFWRWSWHM